MDEKVMMRIEVRDENNDIYEIKQDIKLLSDFGRGFKDEFAKLINKFMDLMTYPDYKKDYIFLESITEEEYDFLLNALNEYRKNSD